MIEISGLKIKTSSRLLPPPGYVAITLFGKILMRKTEQDALKYFNTIRGKTMLSHEYIHIKQYEDVGSWLKFYILYIWYFLKLYICTFNWKMSYYTVPFEAEAYAKQKPKYMMEKSDWKSYKMSNKQRKAYFKHL